MRRTLHLLAALVVGAVSSASAQLLLARRADTPTNPYGLLVHVSGLLDDKEWSDHLNKGYTVQLHWFVQLWHPGRLGLGGAQSPTEWDTEVQAQITLGNYIYTTKVPGQVDDRRTFSTLDSLNAWISTDVPLQFPARRLESGEWYYVVRVDVAALTPEELDNQVNGGGSIASFLSNLVARGKRQTLTHSRIYFTVPR